MELHREIPLQKMTKYPEAFEARILEVVRSQGFFSVSPRYRDMAIRNTCRRMVKKGVLKQTQRGITEVYELPKYHENPHLTEEYKRSLT